MTIQHAIVGIAIVLAVAYIAHLIRLTFRDARSGCYGCKGCALKQQMMKNRGRKREKDNKFECFEKKHGKTFGG